MSLTQEQILLRVKQALQKLYQNDFYLLMEKSIPTKHFIIIP